MSGYEDGPTPRVTFEIWRIHEIGKDVRIYHDMDEAQGLAKWVECEADKADGYPNAPIEFHLVRATTDRVRHSTGHALAANHATAAPGPTTQPAATSDEETT